MKGFKKQMVKFKCLIVICLLSISSNTNGQIVKVLLSGDNDCNGELEVGIYVRASYFSPLDFKIGSSSIFLNYEPTIVAFSGYTPQEFHDVEPLNEAWADQKVTADNECGISNIVLQMQDNTRPNMFLTKQTLIHVGTATFNILLEGADPQIVLNQRFTHFNRAETNDGTQTISLENYPKVLDYNCLGACPGPPVISNVSMNPSLCSAPTGSISLNFTDNLDQTDIEFSLDGGFTYPYSVNDNIGSTVLPNLSSGTYDLWVRWGNDECPLNLADVTISNTDGLVADKQAVFACGENNNGKIIFNFPDHPTQTSIQFSIDGGFTFPYSASDDAGSIEATDLASGQYNTWARWGDTSCPTSLGFVSIQAEDYPELSVFDMDICGTQTTGIIQFSFDDHPQYTTLEISIDGGQSYPYTSNDLDGSYLVDGLASGTYDIWSRWQNLACTNFIETVVILTDDAPVFTHTAKGTCFGNVLGEIQFDFEDHPGRSHIEFSIDGGSTYHAVTDSSGSFTFTDLDSGNYQTSVRWGNNECPINVGAVNVPLVFGPDVYFYSKENSCVESNTGSLTIGIIDDPSYSNILVSIDGGVTFPITIADNIGLYTVVDLGVGQYDIQVKWDDGTCQRQVANASIGGTICDTCTDGILNGSEEYIDCGGGSCVPCDMCPFDEVTISERPMPNDLSIRAGHWVKSDGLISSTGDVTIKAATYVELMSGFELLSGGQLLIGIEGCENN